MRKPISEACTFITENTTHPLLITLNPCTGNKLIYIGREGFILGALVADVAELADALDSTSGTLTSVWVRPPPSAPY
jgi:hypothetical protein